MTQPFPDGNVHWWSKLSILCHEEVIIITTIATENHHGSIIAIENHGSILPLKLIMAAVVILQQ
jgi:hypothetical protein